MTDEKTEMHEDPQVDPSLEDVVDIQEPEDEAAKLKDQLLRTLAELENLRKRSEREREDTAKYAVASFARDLLSVADNLHRAIDAVPADAPSADPALKTLIDGVEITRSELLNCLSKHGIKKISPQAGDTFDHNAHQAMFEVDSTDHPSGAIANVMQDGYMIHDRLLRPALVGVVKKSEEN